jgi:hypothetical protein
VIAGAYVSSRAPDTFIRPVLALVLTLSGLKLLDVPNEVLGALLVLAVVGGVVAWFVRRRQSASASAVHEPARTPPA